MRSPGRTKETRTPIAISPSTSVRKSSKPRPTEPFHVAVDRQLKSAHETYEAAEKAAQKIKSKFPQLNVTIFDAKEGVHSPVQQQRNAGASHNNNKNRVGESNSIARTRAAVSGHK
jgi:FtsZ-interacting cell division protein ZipA